MDPRKTQTNFSPLKNKNPAYDAYIAKAESFAQPLLHKLRAPVHQACPEIEETIKWSNPFFCHRGPVIRMASFKEHVRFGFWKESALKDPQRIFKGG